MLRRIARLTFLGLDVLLVVLYLIGYATAYFHPRYSWWAELIAVGLPYLTVVLLVATLVVLWMRRWSLAAVHLGLLLLAALRFLPPTGLPAQGEPSPDDLTLMTFNVSIWAPNMDDKRTGLRRLVEEEAPDLLALQESPVRYTEDGQRLERVTGYLDGLFDGLDYRVSPVRLEPTEEPLLRTAQPVLSNDGVTLKSQRHIPLRETDGTTREAKVVRTVFEWQGREGVLYNVHLRSFGRDKPWDEDPREPLRTEFWRRYLGQYRGAFQERAHETEQLRAMIDAETRPVIVAGDFNSTPHSWTFRMIAHGKQDAFRRAGRGWGATYHSRLPFVRIDHVVASPEWEVVSAQVSDTWFSEHRPLFVRLRWRDR